MSERYRNNVLAANPIIGTWKSKKNVVDIFIGSAATYSLSGGEIATLYTCKRARILADINMDPLRVKQKVDY